VPTGWYQISQLQQIANRGKATEWNNIALREKNIREVEEIAQTDFMCWKYSPCTHCHSFYKAI